MLRKCQLVKAEPRRGSRLPLRFFHNFRLSSLLTCLLLIIIIAQLPFTASAPTQQVASSSLSPSSTSTRHNEMLVPLNSTTALICEPVFHAGGQHAEEEETAEARWMRDGREVARVSGHSNAVIGQLSKEEEQKPPADQDPIPEIGFLVIRQTQREDQGDYWCERTRDGVQGERTRLRVAFLEPFAAGQRPALATPVEGSGQLVILDCPPRPNGVPPPILSWQLNGERITDFPALKLQVAPNGSLLISDFSAHQSGFYACEAANFVSKSVSEPLFLAAPLAMSNARKLLSAGGSPSSSTTFVHCLSAYVRNGVLWFLIGSLSTSCVVLAYILGALFLHRLYSLQQHQYNIYQNNNNNINNRWRPSRSLFAGPGFRKVVAPMAEPIGGQAMPGGPPPPYESASESSSNSRHNSDGNSREQFDV